MKPNFFVLTIGLLLASVSNVQGQSDFFWAVEWGGLNSDAIANYKPGESGSLYLYYSTNGPSESDLSTAAFLDIATSNSGVIKFTHAETFDFQINVGGTPIGNRWLDFQGGGGSAGKTGDVFDDFIDELHAFTITGGPGILEFNNGSGAFLDEGYNSFSEAFLFGMIEFDVIGSPGSSVDLLTSVGAGSVVNGNTAFEPVFGEATINILGIPEPSTCSCFAILLLGVVVRRR